MTDAQNSSEVKLYGQSEQLLLPEIKNIERQIFVHPTSRPLKQGWPWPNRDASCEGELSGPQNLE